MTLVDVIGSVSGVLTTLAFVPQAVKTLRTRQTRDISTAMWLLFCIGVVGWLVYGILLAAMPIILANGVTLVLASLVLMVKLTNRRYEHASGPVQECGTRTSLNQ